MDIRVIPPGQALAVALHDLSRTSAAWPVPAKDIRPEHGARPSSGRTRSTIASPHREFPCRQQRSAQKLLRAMVGLCRKESRLALPFPALAIHRDPPVPRMTFKPNEARDKFGFF